MTEVQAEDAIAPLHSQISSELRASAAQRRRGRRRRGARPWFCNNASSDLVHTSRFVRVDSILKGLSAFAAQKILD